MNSDAKWISSPVNKESEVYSFKKRFTNTKKIKKAVLYVSALGVYAAYLNDARVGKNVLAPGWTSYRHRVQFQEYDVTELLKDENLLEIGVAPGWATGVSWDNSYPYIDCTTIIAHLEIEYIDGTTEDIVTDTDWEVWTSQVISSQIYHGETVDKTAEIRLLGNAELKDVNIAIIRQVGEDITEQEIFAPKEVICTPKGELVIDFGQNMTGYVQVHIKGNRGDRIVIHHAEVLDKDGNFYNANYREAKNENIYILSGDDDVFKPTYTFQGFRYIRLTEYPYDTVNVNDFRAIVVHSEMERTGYFKCGNEKINQLYHNIIWGHKSNYLDIPTDCPQRNERLGWTGDTQVFCRTAAINFDVEKFLTKWMEDLSLEQYENGAVSGIVPDCSSADGLSSKTCTSCGWGDAACIVPWELYLAYGNKDILRKFLPTMKKWVNYQRSAGNDEFLWLTGRHYGDWLSTDNGPDNVQGATSNDLIASAFYAYSTSLVIKAGEALGEDVSEYKELYTNVVTRFREYFMENGMPKEELPLTEYIFPDKAGPVDFVRKGITQTAICLILRFNLCTEEERPKLAQKLAELIHTYGDRMTTGFLGTPHILHALSENGYTELAYKLLFREESPSWLYSVNHGATTMWEHWDSIREDGSFWPDHMNSFNHYAYGAVYDWIFNVALGVAPTEKGAGYKEIILKPNPNINLGFAQGSFKSRQGEIKAHWYYKDNAVHYEYEIPEGVTAHLTLPSGYSQTLGGGKYHFFDIN